MIYTKRLNDADRRAIREIAADLALPRADVPKMTSSNPVMNISYDQWLNIFIVERCAAGK